MKITIAILIAIVAALGWQLSAEKTASSQQQTLIADLTTKLDNKTARENLERQKTCAAQAEKAFRQMGFSAADRDMSQNHFDAKLNKCFLGVTSYVGSMKMRSLYDAYEQRTYADFQSSFPATADYSPPYCRLTPLGESATTCKSEDEYDAFVARYME